jgi:hypothetical protein
VNVVDVVCIHENRKIKSVEIILRRGGVEWETIEEVNLANTYCKYICKFHNVYPCTTLIC